MYHNAFATKYSRRGTQHTISIRSLCLAIIVLSFIGTSCAPLSHTPKAQAADVIPRTIESNIDSTAEVQVLQDSIAHYKARVTAIYSDQDQDIIGTGIRARVQRIQVEIISESKRGEQIELDNDRTPLDVGDVVYVTRTTSQFDEVEYWAVTEPYRLPWLIIFTILFVGSVILFGGIQGLRGLLSLAGSLLLIIYVLLPGVLFGFSPVVVSLIVAALIIVLGSYVTHGFSKMTSAAVIGMIVTVIATGLLTWFGVEVTQLSGFESEESVYLNFNTGGTIDFRGLLLGGILIGLLGALYDVAIGQAISVEELHRIGPHIPRRTIYSRAIRMGREHIGALVNTLAIAYAGASLPLLLLFYSSSTGSLAFTINREIFATEIIRTMIGGFGLVLAVPFTTLVAVWLLVHPKRAAGSAENTDQVSKEMKEINALTETHGHGHSHSHGHSHGHGHSHTHGGQHH